MYSSTVLDHFGNPRNVGRPAGANAVGISGDPSAGPFMRVFLVTVEGRIQRAGFETYGCVASIAAGSVLTEWLAGKSLIEARSMTAELLEKMLGGLPLGKNHCAATAVRALKLAVELAKTETR
ncbi:MAG: iron-sulfur cluster assembly scaffold protein [Planctomycetes bacterium]|nr:iron-sulfur cluster assembly scaffold protein [Planctomycetota bacterium]